ncbi:MAG: NAD(P)H-nitrite reductase [Mycobacterium sp.]|nr:NAD(P)H-nitrite reductase [Mycobacterium sp.]
MVDAQMRTSVEGGYAAGDVALAWNNSAGVSAAWDGVLGFWSTIGTATPKYHAWGDGHQHSRLIERDGGFTVWYESDGVAVGVLTMNADDDYDRAEDLIRQGKPVPVGMP